MSKVYLISVDRLNIDDLRKAFKKVKADARAKAASNVEGERDGSKSTS